MPSLWNPDLNLPGVLLLDPEALSRATVSRWLQPAYRVVAAPTVEAAALRLHSRSFALALVSFPLPGVSRMRAEDCLRLLRRFCPIVIALVPDNHPDRLLEVLAAGMDDWIVKSCLTVDTLSRVIDRQTRLAQLDHSTQTSITAN